MAKQKSTAAEVSTEQETVDTAVEVAAEQNKESVTPTPKEEVETTPKQESKAAPQAASEKEACFVYIGPTLPGGVLKKNASFIGTASEVQTYLASVIAEYPNVLQLLVPSCALAGSKARMNAGGNVLRKTYENAAKKQKEVTDNG